MDVITHYLTRIAPLVSDGYISIHRKWKRTDGKKGGFPGDACRSIQEAVKSAKYWAHQRGEDVYLSQGGQREHGGKRDNSHTFVAVRQGFNVIALSSLYMDVDVDLDPDKDAYRSVEELEQGLADFYQQTNFPNAALVVCSGRGGRHLYWPFSRLLHPVEFTGLAHSLVSMGQAVGLKFDASCSIDITRLLRLPGTFNFKEATPLPTSLLYDTGDVFDPQDLAEALAPWWTEGSTIHSSGGHTNDDEEFEDNNELGAGIEDTYQPAEISQVAKVCPFVENTIATSGAGQSQTLWFLALGLACHTTDPDTVAHSLSSGHYSYEATETSEKLKELQATRRLNARIGPPHCSVLHKAGAKECGTCKHLNSNSNPISLSYGRNGHAYPSAGQSKRRDFDLPSGHYRDSVTGHVYEEGTQDEDGNQSDPTKVFPYTITNAFIETVLPYRCVFQTDEHQIVKTVYCNVTSDHIVAAKELAAQGIILNQDKERKFFVAFMKHIRTLKESLIRVPAIGWHSYENEMGFAFNEEFVTPTQRIRCHHLPPEGSLYGVVGNDKPWRDLANIVVSPNRPDLSIIVASGFAAPLVVIAGQLGFLVGAWSSLSGIGKTTAITLSQAIWGSPTAISGLADTTNHIFAKAAMLRNLGVCFDEIKSPRQQATFLDLIFQITSGREKGRANRDGSLKATKDWQTTITYCCNASMCNAVENDTKGSFATLYRMFEYQCLENVPTIHSPSDIGRMFTALQHNYGSIGRIYGDYLGANYDRVSTAVKYIQNDLERKLNAAQEERFWLAAMATHMAAAYFAKKLGLAPFNLSSMEAFMLDEFKRMRQSKLVSGIDYSNVDAVIAEVNNFLKDHRAKHTVVTDTMLMQAGRPSKNAVKVLNDVPGLTKDSVWIQISVDKKQGMMLRVSDSALGRWCKLRNVPKSSLCEALKAKLGGRVGSARIGSGTPYADITEPCWTIALTGTALEREVEWAEQYT